MQNSPKVHISEAKMVPFLVAKNIPISPWNNSILTLLNMAYSKPQKQHTKVILQRRKLICILRYAYRVFEDMANGTSYRVFEDMANGTS